MKIIVSPRPDLGIAALFELGLMRFVIPELMDMPATEQDARGHQHKDVLAHTLQVLAGVPAEPTLRLAALLHDVGKPKTKSIRNGRIHFYRHEDVGARMTREILRRLKVDSATVNEVTKLVALHMRSNLYTSDWSDGAVRRFIREVGDSRERLLVLSRADITSYRPRRIEAGLVRVAELEARCQQLVGEADVERMDSPPGRERIDRAIQASARPLDQTLEGLPAGTGSGRGARPVRQGTGRSFGERVSRRHIRTREWRRGIFNRRRDFRGFERCGGAGGERSPQVKPIRNVRRNAASAWSYGRLIP